MIVMKDNGEPTEITYFLKESRTNEIRKNSEVIKENALKQKPCISIFKGLIYNPGKPNTDGSVLRDILNFTLKKKKQNSKYPGKNKQVKGKTSGRTTKEKHTGNFLLYIIISQKKCCKNPSI